MSSRNNDDAVEEEYEILDLSEYRSPVWIRQLIGDVSRQSAGKQLAVGGATGWCAGYVFSKIGRVAAAAMGTSLILIQVAQYNGYININWNNVNRSVKKARQSLNRETTRHIPRYLHQLQDFLQQNMIVGGGFAGGFLLGIAT